MITQNEIESIKQLHDVAMDAAEEATVHKVRGDREAAARASREAYRLERQAALATIRHEDYEPTRSVLFRSAASLAIECGDLRDAERLINIALAGNPHEEIANELRDLLTSIFFDRSLQSRNLTLGPDELELSLSGELIGVGIASSEEYVERVQTVEKIIQRTAERKMGITYREGGSPSREVKTKFEVFLTVPRHENFAVTMKIGKPLRQLDLPFNDDVSPRDVLDEMVVCLDALNAGNDEAVKDRIETPAYYTNFVALSKRLAPDGEDVKQVGLSIQRNGRKHDVTFRRIARDISISPKRNVPKVEVGPPNLLGLPLEPDRNWTEVRGALKFADSRQSEVGTIILVENNIEHLVAVPEGYLSDIVRPLWDSEVIIRGPRFGNRIIMEDIQRASRRRGKRA